MYSDCIAWVSSTDCLHLTTVYQLLHPDWRRTPRKRQHGWTDQHDSLLQTLTQQLLDGEIPSIYYASIFDYQLAAKKHLLNNNTPFVGEPTSLQASGGFQSSLLDRSSVGKMADDYDADDEHDMVPDIANTEHEVGDLNFPPKLDDVKPIETSASLSSLSQSEDDDEFLVYSVDLSTNQTRAYTYLLTEVDILRGKFKSYASWDILSSMECS